MNKIVASLAFIFGCDSSIGRNGYYFLRRNLFTLWRNILTPMTFSSFCLHHRNEMRRNLFN